MKVKVPVTPKRDRGIGASKRGGARSGLPGRVGIVMLTVKGLILGANPDLCQAINRRREKIIGTKLESIVGTSDREKVRSCLKRMAAGEVEFHVLTLAFHGTKERHRVEFTLQRSPTRNEEDFVIAVVSGMGAFLEGEEALRHNEERVKRTEDALRASEERMRMAAQTGRMYAFEWIPATDEVIRSAEAEYFAEGHEEGDTGRDFLSKVHPDDRRRYNRIACGVTFKSPDYHITYRMMRPNGEVVWVEERGHGFFNDRRKLERMVGITVDITDRVKAEAALKQLSGRLLTVQEEERRRIARELHDDIGQDVALLRISTQRALRELAANPEFAQAVHELDERQLRISQKIRNLSHQLHSSELELLGLCVAVESLCRSFAANHRMKISCTCSKVPSDLDQMLGLCFYRITQEALQNAKKHSGTHEVRVELAVKKRHLVLSIRDKGAGFNPERALQASGLGLLSMRERMNLVDGELRISSSEGKGTTLVAQAPVRKRVAARGVSELVTR